MTFFKGGGDLFAQPPSSLGIGFEYSFKIDDMIVNSSILLRKIKTNLFFS